jgi:hypothetical protein
VSPRRLFLADRELGGAQTKGFLNGDSHWLRLVPGGRTC